MFTYTHTHTRRLISLGAAAAANRRALIARGTANWSNDNNARVRRRPGGPISFNLEKLKDANNGRDAAGSRPRVKNNAVVRIL